MPELSLVIAADHPGYAGHFPGRPILPGVVLLDRAQGLIEGETGLPLTGIAHAKFLSPVAPGEALTLSYEPGASGIGFDIRAGARRMATGRFTVAAVP